MRLGFSLLLCFDKKKKKTKGNEKEKLVFLVPLFFLLFCFFFLLLCESFRLVRIKMCVKLDSGQFDVSFFGIYIYLVRKVKQNES